MGHDVADEGEEEDGSDQFYIDVIQRTVYGFAEIFGEKVALENARKAPLNITVDGQVTGYYGSGKEAFDMLVQQYESMFGKDVADRKVRNMLHGTVSKDEKHLLPERLQPEKPVEKTGVIEQARQTFPFLCTA